MWSTEEIELALGRRDDNNTFPIQERGHSIEALANILEKYLAIYPSSVLIMNWLDAAHTSAKNCMQKQYLISLKMTSGVHFK